MASRMWVVGFFLLMWRPMGWTQVPTGLYREHDVVLFQGDSITDGGRQRTGLDYNHIMGQEPSMELRCGGGTIAATVLKVLCPRPSLCGSLHGFERQLTLRIGGLDLLLQLCELLIETTEQLTANAGQSVLGISSTAGKPCATDPHPGAIPSHTRPASPGFG